AGLQEWNISNISAPTMVASRSFSLPVSNMRGAIYGWPRAGEIGFVSEYSCDPGTTAGPNHDRFSVTLSGVVTKFTTGLTSATSLVLMDLGTSFIEPNCTNNIDDNGTGGADCADRSCRGVLPCAEHACIDGSDNDGDGNADCGDADCRGVGGCG